MKVIPPLKISDAMLTASSAVETAPAAYNSGTTYGLNATASVAGSAGLITVYKSLQAGNTGHAPGSSPTWWTSLGETYQVYSTGATYAQGDRVIDAVNHIVYESAVAGNLNQALTIDTKWIEVGPTNKWAMFDLLRSTATVQPKSITATIAPGTRVDAIAFLGMVGDSLAITVTSGGNTVYSRAEDLRMREIGDWYDYFFRPFGTKPSIALFDLPPFTDAVISWTLTATSGNAELGAAVVGLQEDIGQVLYEPESDVLNFSTVSRDFAGGVNAMVQRRNVPKTIQQILAPKASVNRIRAVRDALNAKPAVWAGLDDSNDGYFEALLILGFYKKFTINLRHQQYAVLSLELEEI